MRTDVIVIGAGHSGLAASYFLSQRGIDHVVLERGEVGQSWRTERWDSLRLLTPNRQSRLPGSPYTGDDPDGYMTMTQVVEFLDDYSTTIAAPVRTGVTVTAVRTDGDHYEVETTAGIWHATAVIIASGACNLPKIPQIAQRIPAGIDMVVPQRYRNPAQLAPGAVLVVGASASGAQIASELRAAGREVTVAVGEHVRMPRTYRGRDIMWWMERSGKSAETYTEIDDIVRARHLPSPQLMGSDDHADLNLNTLTAQGIQLVGRLAAMNGSVAQFSGSLRNVCQLADLKMRRLLDVFDEWAISTGTAITLPPVEHFEPTRVPDKPQLTIDLVAAGITSIVWATGYSADYSWLDVPGVLNHKGQLRHDGGIITGAPGLYCLGLPVLRHRNSTFIFGAEADARAVVAAVATRVQQRQSVHVPQ